MRVLHEPHASERLVDTIGTQSKPLFDARDLDPVMERVGDARYVLLGEATHGTREFYSWRIELTKRLITEKQFSFVAVEGDWPASQRLNQYVLGASDDENAHDALRAFDRWPTWMWANQEIEGFAEWLRGHNAQPSTAPPVTFHGLDVYSLWDSMRVVIDWLREHEHEALPEALRAFECFEPYHGDEQAYAAATAAWVPQDCRQEVAALLARVRNDSLGDSAEALDIEQNAIVMQKAESYYRAMVRGGATSWNLRDEHMTDTLERLMDHGGREAKAIVWAHNTHVGDARYTDMREDAMWNVGQLVRESHAPNDVVLVGFGTHHGSVVAGRRWGAAARRMRVPAAREASWEDLFHTGAAGDRLLMLDELRYDEEALQPRGHRAIGVVYDPSRESWGNYVPTVLPRRYDCHLHFERTHALHPLHVPVAVDEMPETYPFGA